MFKMALNTRTASECGVTYGGLGLIPYAYPGLGSASLYNREHDTHLSHYVPEAVRSRCQVYSHGRLLNALLVGRPRLIPLTEVHEPVKHEITGTSIKSRSKLTTSWEV